MKAVVFDVDGTLISDRTVTQIPRLRVVALLHLYQDMGYSVQVWSAGGKEHAERTIKRLKLRGVPGYSKPTHPYTRAKVKKILGVYPDIQVDNEAKERLPGVQFVFTPDN
jgi:predicted HAD superfamily phosphohydrolase YqeG